MFCEKCKTQIPDDSKYCKECGIKMPTVHKPVMPSSQSIPPPIPPPIIIPPSSPPPLPKPATATVPPPLPAPSSSPAVAPAKVPSPVETNVPATPPSNSKPDILKYKLVFKVVSGSLTGKKYSIDEPAEIRIGRGSDCMIRITKDMDAGVSRHHCKLNINPPLAELTDLGSSNGTLINNQQLEPNKKYALNSGDTFKLGDNIFSVETKSVRAEDGAAQE